MGTRRRPDRRGGSAEAPRRGAAGLADPAPAPPRSRPRRVSPLALFALLSAACLAIAAGALSIAMLRADAQARRALAVPAAAPARIADLGVRPRLLFLQTDGDAYRRLGMLPLDGLRGLPALTELQCQRVHFAAGRGLCVGQAGQGSFTFGPDLRPVHSLSVTGIPSRARVSPDGRFGAITTFVEGHSYADGAFSTQTLLIDMATGATLTSLEELAVTREGAPFRAIDFNFWGVTFARDSNRFYATLASGGKTYLVEGDVAARTARVLRENVECPSLSPDDTRLVFKKRVSGGVGSVVWRLHRLDLSTMEDTPLAETRNVDDQVEWLDTGTVLYALPDEGPPASIRPDVWLVPVDGSGPPRRIQTSALSPSVVR